MSARQSALAPASSSMNGPLSEGISGASAARDTPLIRLTMKVPPMMSAPVLPADTNASPSPAASWRMPSAMEQSLCSLRMDLGSSSMLITSGASTISIPVRGMSLSAATRRISSSRPTRTTVCPYSATAMAAPLITSSGALSPPNASTMIRILSRPFLSICRLRQPVQRPLRQRGVSLPLVPYRLFERRQNPEICPHGLEIRRRPAADIPR